MPLQIEIEAQQRRIAYQEANGIYVKNSSVRVEPPGETPSELAQPSVETKYTPRDAGGAIAVTDSKGIVYNHVYDGE